MKYIKLSECKINQTNCKDNLCGLCTQQGICSSMGKVIRIPIQDTEECV